MSNLQVNTITDEAGTGAPDFTNGVKVAGNNIPTSGPLSGFRNAIINGNFDHWQRGTSLTAFVGFNYLADRWANVGIGSSVAPSRQAFSLGQTDVPNEPKYFHRSVVSSTAGASNQAHLQYRVEDVRTFSGQTVTLSFYAKADAAKDIAVEFAQNFGTGGSPSAEVTAIDVTTSPLTTSWQKFTITTSLPSLSGKTLGADNNHRLVIIFYFDAGSDFNARTNSLGQQSGTFDIAQVQLEAGSVATPFERRAVGTELALCQRYFERVDAPALMPRADVGVTNRNAGVVYWKVSKRANPTVVGSGYDYEGHHTSTPGILNQSPTAVRLEFIGSDYRGGGGLLFWDSFTADAEL